MRITHFGEENRTESSQNSRDSKGGGASIRDYLSLPALLADD